MASRGVNKVLIVGNLGQDPEVKYTQSGSAITNISVVTSEEWKDKTTGQKQSKVEWHRVVFFNRLAEIAGEYLRKGSKVYVEGRLQTRKWQDQSGQDRYTTEIVANEMQMLDSRGEGHHDAPQKPPQPQTPGQRQRHSMDDLVSYPQGAGGPVPSHVPEQRPMDDFDDIPFN